MWYYTFLNNVLVYNLKFYSPKKLANEATTLNKLMQMECERNPKLFFKSKFLVKHDEDAIIKKHQSLLAHYEER